MRLVSALLPFVAISLAFDQTPLGFEPEHLDAVPLLGFGTWNLDKSNASEVVSWAIQTGYRHIDCAAAYGNEVEVGRGIADGLTKAGLSRDDLWITSKLWNDRHDDVQSGIENTLRDLGLDYLNLYLMHWPIKDNKTAGKTIEYITTWKDMINLVDQGLTKDIGVANFSPAQLKDLILETAYPPAVHQMELHPYLQQSKWVDLHQKHNIHVTAYSPFAGTNPTYDPKGPKNILDSPVIREIAKKRGCTPAQVVLKWGLQRGTSVIPKSQRKNRITENFETLSCKMLGKDFHKIDKLGKEHHRFNNPSKAWGVDLYEGLEDSKGKHKLHS